MRIDHESEDGTQWTATAEQTTDENGEPTVKLHGVTGTDIDGNRAPITPEVLTDLAFIATEKLGLPHRGDRDYSS